MTLRTLKKQFGLARNFQLLLGIGQITLVAAILLGMLDLHLGWSDFLEGMLIGISIVTNMAGLTIFGRKQRENGDSHG